jgi:hypothetical protein
VARNTFPQYGLESSAQGLAQAIANAHQAATQQLTCCFCGQAYPPGTPSHGSQVLTDHIRICEKHPMRQVEADKAKLRAALATLVGVDTKEELEQMEAVIRLSAAPAADKAGIIDAIHALLSTL